MLRLYICAFFVLVITTAAAAQDHKEYILFKDFAVQFKARDSMLSRFLDAKDSAKSIDSIASLEEWADRKGDDPLRYGFRLTKYQYLSRGNHIANREDFERDVLALITDLQRDGLQLLEAEALAFFAEYYWNRKAYALGFENCIKAYNIYTSYSSEAFPLKSECIAKFGGKYYYFKDFKTAGKYFAEALAADNYHSISLHNTLALCFSNLGMYDSAKAYFDKAYLLAEQRNDVQWIGLLSGNIGNMYYKLGQYDKSMALLEKELKINLEQHSGDRYNAANTLALASSIYLLRNQKEKAMADALKAYEIALQEFPVLPYEIKKNIFPALASAYAANGNMAMAYAFLDSADVAKDSIARRTNLMVLAGAQHNMDADKHLAEIQKYEHEQKVHVLVRDSLIAGIVLLILIAGLLVNSERIKYRNRKKQLEAEKIRAETELQHASAQLSSFTESIAQKNELIENFAAEIGRLQKHFDVASLQQNETLLKLQQSTILTDQQWDSFKHMFEKVHRGFMKRLHQKVKGLSPIDIRFMLLSKLRLSAKEMSAIMGISSDAVRQNCQRLRHKLSLQDNTSLEDFADTI